jgi:hypothetical protein
MPLVTVSPTTVTIPVVNPGQAATDNSLGLTFNPTPQTEQTTVTLSITDAPVGMFVAELYGLSVPGGGLPPSKTLVATTGIGEGGSATGTLTKGPSYNFTINFYPPALPVPGSFSATLVVSWSGGSASVLLSGTTAEIRATVDTTQPIKLKPGGQTSVPIKIAYASGDATTLDVNVIPSNFPAPLPSGLTITGPSTPTSLAAAYSLAGQNPKQPQSGPPAEVLNPDRTAVITLSVSANQSIEPANMQPAYVNVSVDTPDLTQLAPAPVEIKFDITPLPVTVSIMNQPIKFKTTTQGGLEISIKGDGAPTFVEFGAVSAKYASDSEPVDITIAWPQGISTSNTINAPIGASSNDRDGQVNVTVPFTAYNGLFKNTLAFQLTLLPYTDVLNLSQGIPPASATGQISLTWNSDGNVTMTGAFNRNESINLPGDPLGVSIAWVLTDSTGRQYVVKHGGWFENNWQFNKSVISPEIQEYWDDFMPGFGHQLFIGYADNRWSAPTPNGVPSDAIVIQLPNGGPPENALPDGG